MSSEPETYISLLPSLERLLPQAILTLYLYRCDENDPLADLAAYFRQQDQHLVSLANI